MVSDIFREKLLTRRALLLGGLKGVLITGLMARLSYLQVVQSKKYEVLAEENRINLQLISPVRGEILDRKGIVLASNRENFRIILIPEQAESIEKTLNRVQRLIGLTPLERQKVMRDVERNRPFMPITVRENLSWEQVARIEVNTLEIPGVQIEVGSKRYYPFKDVTYHMIGYVGRVSEEDLSLPGLLHLTDFRVGKSGLEREYEKDLGGEPGARQVEVNATGRIIRELTREQGRPGKTLDLTVDIDLQQYIFDRLGEEVGAVSVMNAYTGELYAFVSKPAFDPNEFHFGIATDDWQGLLNHPRKPLINRMVSGQYAPASTFKMVVALAGLQDGWAASEKVYCPGYYDFGDRRFHCWKEEGHGSLDLAEAIAQSCDVYFYDMSKSLGIDKIAAMARRFGLGDRTGLNFPDERSGIVPDTRWVRERFNKRWQKGETLIAGIGQGYLLSTPIQLAVMTAGLCNGGIRIKPVFRREYIEKSPEFLNIPKGHLDLMKKSMDMVCNHPTGTAFYNTRIRDKDKQIAGKTGTAQVKRISLRERQEGIIENKDREWFLRDHALFVGYAPKDNPQFVVSVVIEHGGGGGAVAAPIARDVLLKTQELIAV